MQVSVGWAQGSLGETGLAAIGVAGADSLGNFHASFGPDSDSAGSDFAVVGKMKAIASAAQIRFIVGPGEKMKNYIMRRQCTELCFGKPSGSESAPNYISGAKLPGYRYSNRGCSNGKGWG